MSARYRRLTLEDFADLFGAKKSAISARCRRHIASADFRYSRLGPRARQAVLALVSKKIQSDPVVAGKKRRPAWEKGWSENLKNFVSAGFDVAQLTPKYFRPNQPLRLYQDYVLPVSSTFESNWYKAFSLWLFESYLTGVDTIYEFGCGSGHNLSTLAALYPKKKIIGLDWARSSVNIAGSLAKAYGWNIEGRRFDFFAPAKDFHLKPGSAVLTIGALEQTGQKYGAFLKYLLKERPALVIHVEPVCEWYDGKNPVDRAAIRFHKHRHYWMGYPGVLKELVGKGKIEILKSKRAFFGSLYLEGYSQLIWRPK